jgi:hypothetical protein
MTRLAGKHPFGDTPAVHCPQSIEVNMPAALPKLRK